MGDIKDASRLIIYDMLGRTIFSTEFKASNDNEIKVPHLKQGVYIVKIQSEKGNYSTKIAWY